MRECGLRASILESAGDLELVAADEATTLGLAEALIAGAGFVMAVDLGFAAAVVTDDLATADGVGLAAGLPRDGELAGLTADSEDGFTTDEAATAATADDAAFAATDVGADAPTGWIPDEPTS